MNCYDFMEAACAGLPADEKVIYCSFPGDPNEDIPGKWAAHIFTDYTQFDPDHNLYVCVMSSRINERGEYRRQKANFGHGLMLMIDDLGDGKGAKNPLSTIDKLKPTALVETSPDNFQAFYFLKAPEPDALKFEALINAFITANFLDGRDPGMRGVNRVARLPGGINGKKKYGGWKVRMVEWNPALRYTIDEIVAAFNLKLIQRQPWDGAKLVPEDVRHRAEVFRQSYRWLKRRGMLKREEPDLGGKIAMTCPWVDEHTDRADSGTYLSAPREENNFCGSFVCYHSSTHNDDNHFGQLLRWIIEQGDCDELLAALESETEEHAKLLEAANQGDIL